MALACTPASPLCLRAPPRSRTVRSSAAARGDAGRLASHHHQAPRRPRAVRVAAVAAPFEPDESESNTSDRRESLSKKMEQMQYHTLKNMEENLLLLNERTLSILTQVSADEMPERGRSLMDELKAKAPEDAVASTRVASPPHFLDLSAKSLLWFQPNIGNLTGVQTTKHPVKPHLRLKMMTKLKAKLNDQTTAVTNLQQIRNFRDLASAAPDVLRPYSVFRCANPLQCNEESATLLQDTLGVRMVLDLRAPDEVEEGELDGPLLGEGATLTYKRKASRKGKQEWMDNVRAALEASVEDDANVGITRCNVSILNQKPFYERLKQKMPAKWQFEQALAEWFFPKQGTKMFMDALNKGGLWLLNEVILDTSGPEIAACMLVIKEAVKMDVPIIVFCRAGKDRTGLLSALTLYCCGIPQEQILKDYTLSGTRKSELGESAMPKGLEEDNFTGAPAEVMGKTLRYLEETWGSPEEYLSTHGFTAEMQNELREALVVKSVVYYKFD